MLEICEIVSIENYRVNPLCNYNDEVMIDNNRMFLQRFSKRKKNGAIIHVYIYIYKVIFRIICK